MFAMSDTKKIGTGLLFLGVLFLFLGVMLFFEGGSSRWATSSFSRASLS